MKNDRVDKEVAEKWPLKDSQEGKDSNVAHISTIGRHCCNQPCIVEDLEEMLYSSLQTYRDWISNSKTTSIPNVLHHGEGYP